MASGCAKEIRKRIEDAPEGNIFINSDFLDLASTETIRRNLNRLVKTGQLKRLMDGIYEKPEYSHLLDEYVSPDPNEVAAAVARRQKWTIVPSGNAALNMLGLSTQVPASYSFASDGPYRVYKLGSLNLEFKHVANKDVTGLSYMTALLIQALKSLGKENVTSERKAILRQRLSKSDKEKMLVEARNSTAWVYEIIKELATEA